MMPKFWFLVYSIEGLKDVVLRAPWVVRNLDVSKINGVWFYVRWLPTSLSFNPDFVSSSSYLVFTIASILTYYFCILMTFPPMLSTTFPFFWLEPALAAPWILWGVRTTVYPKNLLISIPCISMMGLGLRLIILSVQSLFLIGSGKVLFSY